jgi:hypothetical protein
MRRFALVAVAVMAAALGGCASKEQLAKAEHEECVSYGLVAGTADYAQCRMTKSIAREDRSRRVGLAMMGLGGSMMTQSAAVPQPAFRTPVHCWGSSSSFTCN